MTDIIERLKAFLSQRDLTPKDLRDSMILTYLVISRLNQTQGNSSAGLNYETDKLLQHLSGFMSAVFWERGFDFDQPTVDQLTEIKMMMDGMAQVYAMPESLQTALNEIYDSLVAHAKGFPAAVSSQTQALLNSEFQEEVKSDEPEETESQAEMAPEPVAYASGPPVFSGDGEMVEDEDLESARVDVGGPPPEMTGPDPLAALDPESVAEEKKPEATSEPGLGAGSVLPPIWETFTSQGEAPKPEDVSGAAPDPSWLDTLEKDWNEAPPELTRADIAPAVPRDDESPAPALPPDDGAWAPLPSESMDLPPAAAAVLAFPGQPKEKKGRAAKQAKSTEESTVNKRTRKKAASTEPKPPRPPRKRSHKKQALKIDLAAIEVPDDFMMDAGEEDTPSDVRSAARDDVLIQDQDVTQSVVEPEAAGEETSAESVPDSASGRVSDGEREAEAWGMLADKVPTTQPEPVPEPSNADEMELDYASLDVSAPVPEEWHLGEAPAPQRKPDVVSAEPVLESIPVSDADDTKDLERVILGGNEIVGGALEKSPGVSEASEKSGASEDLAWALPANVAMDGPETSLEPSPSVDRFFTKDPVAETKVYGDPFPTARSASVVLPEELEPLRETSGSRNKLWIGVMVLALGLAAGAALGYFGYGLRQVRQATQQAAVLTQKLESVERRLAASDNELATLKNTVEQQHRSARQPIEQVQYIKVGAGVLLYWADGSALTRKYYVYRGKGKQGALEKINDRPMSAHLLWLKKVSPGTWRYAVTGVSPEDTETELSEELNLKFPLKK